MKNVINSFRNEEGQALVEYALILGLVSVVSIASLTAMGTTIDGIFTTILGDLALA